MTIPLVTIPLVTIPLVTIPAPRHLAFIAPPL